MQRARASQVSGREPDRALQRAAIALSGHILPNACPVALLVNIGIANSLDLFPFARVVGSSSLSVRLGFLRLLSVFMARTGTTAICLAYMNTGPGYDRLLLAPR